MHESSLGTERGVRQNAQGGGRAGLIALATLLLVGCPGTPPDTVPVAKRVEIVFLNRDAAWEVEIDRGRARPAKRLVLKPGQGREQAFDLTLEGTRGYEDLEFVAYAHEAAVADKTLRVDRRTQPRLGVVFERDGEGNPTLFVLTNPDAVEWSNVGE